MNVIRDLPETNVGRASARHGYHGARMPDLANPPMGRLDALDIGPKKLTVQTEFFVNPAWRVETKVYLAGALKKVSTIALSSPPEGELQKVVNEFHQTKLDEIVAGLRKLQA